MQTTTHNTEDIPHTGEVGCLVEGRWRRYGVLRVIEITRSYGWDSDEIDSYESDVWGEHDTP